MPNLIGDHGNYSFSVFMDDHSGSATDFDTILTILHTQYFLQCIFGPVYLLGAKTQLFADSLEVLGFLGSVAGLKPIIKHQERIRDWPVPTNRAELDAFVWLMPFLRMFMPGRAQLVMEIKKALLKQVLDEARVKQAHDDEVEECDQDSSKHIRSNRSRDLTCVRDGSRKIPSTGREHNKKPFEKVKEAISTNSMAGADPDLQYHLATDAGDTALGGCLSQLHWQQPGTEAIPKLRPP